jgi:pimeloyl-ACP methyl ester carboxylesterase
MAGKLCKQPGNTFRNRHFVHATCWFNNLTKYKMKTIRLVVLVLMAFLTSCNREDSSPVSNHIEELFWVDFKESSMPVVLAGNSTSNIIIIKIHGGPGASSIQEYQASDWLDAFENDYLIAYWDQPFAGYSINKTFPKADTLDVSYFRQSLEAVVAFFEEKEPNKKIVFWGQSWGGLIVSDFITEPTLQSKYEGWINESGLNTNGFRDYTEQRNSIMKRAEFKISQGENKWIEELEWMKQNPYNPLFKDKDLWFKYEGYADELLAPLDPEPNPKVFQSRNKYFNDESDKKRIEENVFGQPFNADLYASDKVYFFNKDSMIPNITKKGIFIQGKFDRSVSVTSSVKFSELSAPFTKMIIYEASGHNPSITERDRFIHDVRDYLRDL